jgi:hypothetical protein
MAAFSFNFEHEAMVQSTRTIRTHRQDLERLLTADHEETTSTRYCGGIISFGTKLQLSAVFFIEFIDKNSSSIVFFGQSSIFHRNSE